MASNLGALLLVQSVYGMLLLAQPGAATDLIAPLAATRSYEVTAGSRDVERHTGGW